jgi:hypothetical protein
MVETVGIRQVMSFVMLESTKDRVIGVLMKQSFNQDVSLG